MFQDCFSVVLGGRPRPLLKVLLKEFIEVF